MTSGEKKGRSESGIGRLLRECVAGRATGPSRRVVDLLRRAAPTERERLPAARPNAKAWMHGAGRHGAGAWHSGLRRRRRFRPGYPVGGIFARLRTRRLTGITPQPAVMVRSGAVEFPTPVSRPGTRETDNGRSARGNGVEESTRTGSSPGGPPAGRSIPFTLITP